MEKLLKLFGLTPMANASLWKSYWTTKLSALQIALGGAAVAFAMMPTRWQEQFPDSFGLYCGLATVVVGFLTPPAAATAQRLPTKDP